MRRRTVVAFASFLLLGLVSAALLSSEGAVLEGAVVFTEVATPEGATSTSRVVLADPRRPNAVPRTLSEGFHAARDPALSPDGRRVLFVGRRGAADRWQVWERALDGGQPRPVPAPVREPRHPAYLGDGRIVFSARGEGDSPSGTALFTVGLDGSSLTRITFHPASELAPTVLRDGRVLYVSRAADDDPAADRLMVVRYDGTAAELFYEHPATQRILGRAWETADGRVVFVEGTADGAAGALVTVSQGRPLHSRTVVGEALDGVVAAAFPVGDERFLLAYRASGDERFGLHELRATTAAPTALEPGMHGDVLDPVMVLPRQRPKVFVSVVDPASTTGTLFCLDARLTQGSPTPGRETATVLRVWGTAGLLGETALESDGSFHIELPADAPVRFQTLDRRGRVVRGPSDWIWVRPNEKRGCIGCHEDRELAPGNRVPLATERPALRVPSAAQEGGA